MKKQLRNCPTYNQIDDIQQLMVMEAINRALDFINDVSMEDQELVSIPNVQLHSKLMLCDIVGMTEQDPTILHPDFIAAVEEVVSQRLQLSIDLNGN